MVGGRIGSCCSIARRTAVVQLTVVRLLKVLLQVVDVVCVYVVADCEQLGFTGMCVLFAVVFIIVGSVVVILAVLIFLRFASVVMGVSATVRFVVVVLRVTSVRTKGRSRVSTEVISDLLLDIIVEASEETVDMLGLSVHTST